MKLIRKAANSVSKVIDMVDNLTDAGNEATLIIKETMQDTREEYKLERKLELAKMRAKYSVDKSGAPLTKEAIKLLDTII